MPRVKLFDEKEVLNKAMQLFWKNGYSATSIQDLVDHLGINRASIYDTFGDKEKLFFKAFENYRKTNTSAVIEFFNSHPNVKDGLNQLFENAIDESIRDKDKKGCFVVNITTELVPGDKKIFQVLEENRITYEKIFHSYLQKGLQEGQISNAKNLQAIATLIFMLYSGLKVVSKVNTSKQELMSAVKEVLSLLD